MTDMRFHDIVIESNPMIGPDGEYHTAVCKSCSTKHRVEQEEFKLDSLFNLDGSKVNALERHDAYKEVLRYVAEMRAWNCHHEGETPLDGFPDKPDVRRVDFDQ